MEFKEYVELQEAPVETGARIKKDSGDDYDPDQVASVTKDTEGKSKFNPKNHQDVIPTIAKKIQGYFSGLKGTGTHKQAKPFIDKFKLDQSSGARSLASLYMATLKDIMTDKNGNPISLNDEDSANAFKSRLQSDLGDVSEVYPLLFILVNKLMKSGDKAYIDKSVNAGSVTLLRALNAIDSLGDGGSAYKSMSKFKGELAKLNPQQKSSLSSHIQGSLQKIRNDALEGNLTPGDMLGMSNDEYMKLYYPDGHAASSGEGDGGKFGILKQAMFDAIKATKKAGEQQFERDSITDKAVEEFAEFVVPEEGAEVDDELLRDFADAIIAGGKGAGSPISGKVLSRIATAKPNGEAIAHEIHNKLKDLRGDTYDKDPSGPSKPGDTEAEKNLASLKGSQASGDTMSTDEINGLKSALSSMATTRRLGPTMKTVAGKKFSKEDSAEFKKWLASEVEGKDTPLARQSGNLLGRIEAMTEGVAGYDSFLTLFDSRS